MFYVHYLTFTSNFWKGGAVILVSTCTQMERRGQCAGASLSSGPAGSPLLLHSVWVDYLLQPGAAVILLEAVGCGRFCYYLVSSGEQQCFIT